MKITVLTDISPEQILKKRGLGTSNRVRKFIASEVKRLSDPYVPMQQGKLKNNAKIAPDGSTLTYSQPYAHYQYTGQAMAGRAPKHYTGKSLSHHGAPKRGKQWEKRMLADRGDELRASVARKVGGE